MCGWLLLKVESLFLETIGVMITASHNPVKVSRFTNIEQSLYQSIIKSYHFM